jgi:hypothetical protein
VPGPPTGENPDLPAPSPPPDAGAPGEAAAYSPDDFPDAEVSARDLGALLRQLGGGAAAATEEP